MEELKALQRDLFNSETVRNSMIENGTYTDSIKEFFSKGITECQKRIHQLQTGTHIDTKITVKFSDNNEVLEAPTSKEVFVLCIERFGVEEVYQRFSNYFLTQPDNLTSTVRVAPNRYLVVGLSNETKADRLRTIGYALNRPIFVFFELA